MFDVAKLSLIQSALTRYYDDCKADSGRHLLLPQIQALTVEVATEIQTQASDAIYSFHTDLATSYADLA